MLVFGSVCRFRVRLPIANKYELDNTTQSGFCVFFSTDATNGAVSKRFAFCDTSRRVELCTKKYLYGLQMQ